MIRLLLILATLVIGAVLALIGFHAIDATDADLFGWCGLGLIAVAVALLVPDRL